MFHYSLKKIEDPNTILVKPYVLYKWRTKRGGTWRTLYHLLTCRLKFKVKKSQVGVASELLPYKTITEYLILSYTHFLTFDYFLFVSIWACFDTATCTSLTHNPERKTKQREWMDECHIRWSVIWENTGSIFLKLLLSFKCDWPIPAFFKSTHTKCYNTQSKYQYWYWNWDTGVDTPLYLFPFTFQVKSF